MQWLVPDQTTLGLFPNNRDATFKTENRKPMPSELLLHYNYGAAAVKLWGQATEVLLDYAKPPCPPAPVAALMGPLKKVHNRTTVRQKLKAARAAIVGIGSRSQQPVESEDQEGTWDEDDVMLFFWGNSRAAQERHLKKVHENAQRMEQWRTNVHRLS